MAQVVPGYHKLKNNYDLLWDHKSPEGYLKICAILQKYIDQGISVNTSYNPENYEDHKVPMSEMIKHLVMFYKYGGKQLYYFNTYDGAGEMHEKEFKAIEEQLAQPVDGEDDCESCKI
jgi:ribonucleoside-diphosphate reductase alpha chain